MAKVNLYSTKTKSAKAVVMPKEFTGEVNKSLLTQAIHVYRDRSHKGTSRVKTRAEVELTKAKVYRQKGTGNARHGAKSAPIFVGGGVAHGPKGEKRVLTLPKKMRSKALASALATKAKNGQIALVEGAGSLKKTREAGDLAARIREGEKVKRGKLTFVLVDKNFEKRKFFKNLDRAVVLRKSDLNAYLAYLGGKLVFDNDIFKKTKLAEK